MRVAQISVHGCPIRSLGGKDTGGMNVYVRELSRGLGKLGLSVDVFTRWHDPNDPEVLSIGEKVRLIHIAAGEPEDTPKTDIYSCLPEFLRNLHAFLEREGAAYDLLHSHYWLSAAAADQFTARAKAPHVATFHTLGEVKNRARPAETEPALRLEVERAVVPTADAIVAFTAEEKDNLINIYGAHPDRVSIVPCGTDLGLFHPLDRERARDELGIDDHTKVLLFAGRLQPFKGTDILLRAAASLADSRDVRLLVLGGDADSADEMTRLRSLSSELGIEEKVAFCGIVEHGRMPVFYGAADVCVVPSFHESFGLVAVEALACGTPVVASRVGGLATIVRDGETGYLVDEHTPEAFAQRLDLLLSNERLLRRMGKAAPSSVVQYSWPTVTRQVLEVYQGLVGN